MRNPIKSQFLYIWSTNENQFLSSTYPPTSLAIQAGGCRRARFLQLLAATRGWCISYFQWKMSTPSGLLCENNHLLRSLYPCQSEPWLAFVQTVCNSLQLTGRQERNSRQFQPKENILFLSQTKISTPNF